MPDPAQLRDSTQIVVPRHALEGLRERLEAEYTVTVLEAGRHYRIVGSPVEIKEVNDYLVRQGVALA